MHKRPKNRRLGAILAVVGLTVLAALAAVVLYLAFNRRFIEGMTSGSVKG